METNEIKFLRERALKLEYGFKELSTMLEATEDLRTILENKILENQEILIENRRLKELLFQNTDSKQVQLKESNLFKLEKELNDKESLILKLKREIEALNRKLKIKEDELSRQFQTKIEDLMIAQKNEKSDHQTEIHHMSKRIDDLSSALSYKQEETSLLNNELVLKNEQFLELQNHNKLIVEMKSKECRDQVNALNTQYLNQIKLLEEQVNNLKQQQEGNLAELETILMTRNALNQKINDLLQTNSHLVLENEGLKQTLIMFQKQKDQDDYMYEDQKKKEILHVKRYYETLLEQVERENRSLRSLLDAKNNELEDLWKQPQNRFA